MTPPAPPLPARSRRHTTATMRLARLMYDDGDSWTPTQIVRYLAEQGVSVSLNTVRVWVIPGVADEQRAQNRRAYARRQARATGPSPDAGRAPQPLLDRMRQLRAAGMPFASVATLIRVDWGIDLNAEQVRYYLQLGREPKQPKRRAGL